MMNIKRTKSIYAKLIISFILLTVITTLTVGLSSAFYLNNGYRQQIQEVKQGVLEYSKNAVVNRIFNRVELLSADIAKQQGAEGDLMFFSDTPPYKDNVRVFKAYEYLKGIADFNSDILESITLYYPKSNTIISSQFGYKDMGNLTPDIEANIGWIKESNGSQRWDEWHGKEVKAAGDGKNETAYTNAIFRLKAFPYAAENPKAMICFGVKETAVQKVIREITAGDKNNIFIIDGYGNVITNIGNKELMAQVKLKRNELSGKMHNMKGSFVIEMDNHAYIAGYSTIDRTGWKIVEVTLADQFYNKAITLVKGLVILCSIILLLGLLISGYFARVMYMPLRRLISQIPGVDAGLKGWGMNGENEYDLINRTMANLSIEIGDLQETLKKNNPIIKHNTVISLLKGRVYTGEEMKEKLKMAQMEMSFPYFLSAVMEFNKLGAASFSIENTQFIKIQLINILEDMNGEAYACYAAELSDYSLGIVINSRDKDRGNLEKSLSDIMNDIKKLYGVEINLALGRFYEHTGSLKASHNEAETALKYFYFMEQKNILNIEDIIEREQSRESIPFDILEEFDSSLRIRNLDRIVEILNKTAEMMKQGNYSYEECQARLVAILSHFSVYSKDMGYHSMDNKKEWYFKEFQKVGHIRQLNHWLTSCIQNVFLYLEERDSNRGSDTIKRVKKYITEHLAEDLSLDSAASAVHLNPKYLSKLFIEEEGISFINYITNVRMEVAKTLLMESELSVSDISEKIGYISSSYFIKKFKEAFGDTPTNYRRFKRM